MAEELKLYGLLYVGPEAEKHVNPKSKAEHAIDIYLKCAALCAASSTANGHPYGLITNNARFLQERSIELGLSLNLLSFPFSLAIPNGIPFYSAHFKLEVIEAFSHGNFGNFVALIDVDAVVCRPIQIPASNADMGIIAYDISDQIFPSYGREKVQHDLEAVAGQSIVDARWYGGEFIAGSPQSFGRLSNCIKQVWPRYISNIAALHHVGDEMVASAALAVAKVERLRVTDASSWVVRWWSARTMIQFASLSSVADRSVLHLPADKDFLSSYPLKNFTGADFLAKYKRYATWKSRLRRLKAILRPDNKFNPEI